MKTLNEAQIKTQLLACGVVVQNIASEMDSILSVDVKSEHKSAFIEATVNAIRLNLAAENSDFTAKEIQLSYSPMSRSIIVCDQQPYIVDYADKKGVHLVSMDGEDFVYADIQLYPVIGTICI